MRMQCCLPLVVAACGLLLAGKLPAQGVPAIPASSFASPDVEVTVKPTDGKPIVGEVVVQLINLHGQLQDQTLLKSGRARFNRVPKAEFRVLVMAPGYQQAEKRIDLVRATTLVTVSVELLPISDAEDAASDRRIGALNPKAQKEVGKALEALRTKKTSSARSHLEAAEREAPNSAEVEYLFGVYESQLNDPTEAQTHWNKALSLNPKHLSALLEVGQELLHEKKPAEAMPYLNRAVEAEPSSWRAQALLAEADYMHGNRDGAIRHAERAMELGHERAALLQPFLAGILAEGGYKERAIHTLQEYVKANASDVAAAKQLEQLENPEAVPLADHSSVTEELTAVTAAATALPIPSNWLPPDVDEKVPPVESGAVCSLGDVLQKTGDQLVALVHDVERFTATESLVDQTINRWGVASAPEKRTFTYVVSMEEIRPGHLSVDEYRTSDGNPARFPNGVATNGLPALVMIFHPFYVANYDMTCEGLARWNGGLAWQVHFRQRAGKPILNRGFRIGRSSSHPVALRGRAWISSENYHIVRLETDLVRPVPEIQLVAEHAAIEYGAVNFRGNVNLWLPRSAEVHFDWRGQRVHRRHSFDNYLLFSVDENERIGKPKGANAPTNPNRGDSAGPPCKLASRDRAALGLLRSGFRRDLREGSEIGWNIRCVPPCLYFSLSPRFLSRSYAH
jgi:tetratricopeptide (TPR) repeat protein